MLRQKKAFININNMPRTLSGYQLHMKNYLQDKSKTFTQAVDSWKTLDDASKSKLREQASKVEAKVKAPKRVKILDAPAPAPAPAHEPVPSVAPTSLASAPVKRAYKKRVQ